MKRQTNPANSVLGRSVVLRLSRSVFHSICTHFGTDKELEQFAFVLFSLNRAADETVLLARAIVLPDAGDLQMQGAAGVVPSREFQDLVYLTAQQGGFGILDIHTHPHKGVPHFSGIDEAHAKKNAAHICRLPLPTTHAMVVFNGDLTAHDAVLFDRSIKAYRLIDAIEILGRPIEIRRTGERAEEQEDGDPQYDRQVRIPGWNQAQLARQKVAIVGMGGNGSQIFQTLLSIGVGTEGWIAGIDPDDIERSNLPRIPYAHPEHVGSPKVTVAAQYAGHKDPRVRFYPYPCSVTEQAVVRRIKSATVIVGAGDNDGLRKVCNEYAVRYAIPYIDLGCDIQVDDGHMVAGGQVRVVEPGQNACLVCSGSIDYAAAALELMDDMGKMAHAARGYVRGAGGEATASVANLNATTAQLGVAAFLGLVHGETFGQWDYCHFDQITGQTITANTEIHESCLVCGPQGILALGDSQPAEETTEPPWKPMEADK